MWTIHFLYGGGGGLLELPSEDGGGGADGACLRGVEAGREATGPTLLLPLDFVAGTETKLTFFVSFSSTLSSVLACTCISLSVSVTSRLINLTKKRERKEGMNHVVHSCI